MTRKHKKPVDREAWAQRGSDWKGANSTESKLTDAIERVSNQRLQRLLVGGSIQARSTISAPDDECEREADRVSEAVMGMSGKDLRPEHQMDDLPRSRVQRMCSRCQRRYCEGKPLNCSDCEEKLQRKEGLRRSSAGDRELEQQIASVRSGGRLLSSSARAFFEPRFGTDFSDVRVHTDHRADTAARSINAEAFTIGRNIAFRSGAYQPGTDSGKKLLAHELTHVVQQAHPRYTSPRETEGVDAQTTGNFADRDSERASVHARSSPTDVRRQTPRPKTTDPICKQRNYVWAIQRVLIDGLIDDLKKNQVVEKQLELVRRVKLVRRCGSPQDKTRIREQLDSRLGSDKGSEIWEQAGTPFGGYRGSYPGYYWGAKRRLEELGTSELDPFETVAFDPRTDDPDRFDPETQAAAQSEFSTLEATDILYFYGHQYAQYRAPGVFANGAQTQFVDLRKLAAHGAFDEVKLMISTSCATICKEALNVFANLFPNAVILGYRKSAPIRGSAVRDDFESGIKNLKKPLFLDEDVDVNAIIRVWKSVVEKHHPNDDRRFPGYYKDGTVYYLEQGTWKTMPGGDSANSCRKKGSQISEATD